MSFFGPRARLIMLVLLAAVGLWLFFGNSMRVLGVDIGFVGTFLIAVAAWTSFGLIGSFPRSEGETALSPGEWQAWLGVLFIGAILAATLISVPAFNVPLPITQNHEANAAGRNIAALLIVWLLLSQVMKRRWGSEVTSDERDTWIEQRAAGWGRSVSIFAVISIAVTLGFSPTDRLQQISYPAIAQLLMAAVLLGALADELAAGVLYWRDRHELRQ